MVDEKIPPGWRRAEKPFLPWVSGGRTSALGVHPDLCSGPALWLVGFNEKVVWIEPDPDYREPREWPAADGSGVWRECAAPAGAILDKTGKSWAPIFNGTLGTLEGHDCDETGRRQMSDYAEEDGSCWIRFVPKENK